MIIKEEAKPVYWLPSEQLCFNPSVPEQVDGLLHKYGPEGVYATAHVLMRAACDDMDIGVPGGIREKLTAGLSCRFACEPVRVPYALWRVSSTLELLIDDTNSVERLSDPSPSYGEDGDLVG